ncbi:MAG TPA: alanine--tRNA ligase [Terriglobia bacterium]|nr:alanine--tRNA ligase [Terriglobia bacterium]
MNSNQIRKTFLDFFAARGHRVVRSSPLVPANDPTLLFANAGMNQFKDVFLGREKRDYSRACSSQKCVRAGGKHNDLEQVGRTTRHHTFFEMLGNFSFGDYFKKDAIAWAWELITQGYGIPVEKLYVTTFKGSPIELLPPDDEAYDCWLSTGVSADRIFQLGMDENFWQMGETGPCGPCSEIHYDMGPAASDLGHPDCKFPCDCGRYVELWNLVFMQYEQRKDIKNGVTLNMSSLLPKRSIDTGAGLERLAAVLQDKISNFDTDLFRPLIDEAAELANVEYGVNHETDVSLRIIADHSRAATFLISDGVLPSNEGRGYVLRLIMRRALYHGQTLGLNEPFLYKMSGHVVDMMKGAYPELIQSTPHAAKAIKIEEEGFARTTSVGLAMLEHQDVALRTTPGTRVIPIQRWKKLYAQFGGNLEWALLPASLLMNLRQAPEPIPIIPAHAAGIVTGSSLFLLHDTYGLRPDFVRDVVRNYGLDVDMQGYEAEMQRQRERARASWKGAEKKIASPIYQQLAGFYSTPHPEGGVLILGRQSVFVGYEETDLANCSIVGIIQNEQKRAKLSKGEEGELVLDRTPFYAEAGGQVGDTGRLFSDSGEEVAQVKDTQRPVTGLIVHKVKALLPLEVGMKVTAQVDAERRDAIRRNHTATHLLHAALRSTLGTHVKQAGSLVAPDRLRFDFTHYAPLEEQDRLDIEDLANRHILANEEMHTNVMDVDSAVNSGAMALFGEKYGDKVRVVSVADGSFSKELCGGTHVRRTGDIGLFKIISESSVAAGTRRIEAVTGTGVIEDLRKASGTLARLGETLRAKPGELLAAAEKLAESEKKLRKELEAAQLKRAVASAGNLLDRTRDVNGVKVLAARVEALDRAAMRQMVDNLRSRMGSGVIVLGSAADSNVALVAAVTKDLTARLDAGKIVKAAAAIVEGSGGGRKDLAEAGGKNPARLDESLEAVPGIIQGML